MTALCLMVLSTGVSSAAEPALNPLAAIDRSQLDSFLNRPLFTPSRRPATPAEPADVAPEPAAIVDDRPKLRLLGVIQARGDTIALVIDLATDKRISLRKGDDVGGWRVAEITGDSLALELNGESLLFRSRP